MAVDNLKYCFDTFEVMVTYTDDTTKTLTLYKGVN